MAKLIITRSSEWFNRARGIRILINDKEMGKMANGQKREVELPAGHYVVKAKIDWCGSNRISFDVSGDDTKEVSLSSFGYSWNFVPISLVVVAIVFFLQFILKVDYAGFIGLPVLFIMIYYFSIGRNSYLVIKENNRL